MLGRCMDKVATPVFATAQQKADTFRGAAHLLVRDGLGLPPEVISDANLALLSGDFLTRSEPEKQLIARIHETLFTEAAMNKAKLVDAFSQKWVKQAQRTEPLPQKKQLLLLRSSLSIIDFTPDNENAANNIVALEAVARLAGSQDLLTALEKSLAQLVDESMTVAPSLRSTFYAAVTNATVLVGNLFDKLHRFFSGSAVAQSLSDFTAFVHDYVDELAGATAVIDAIVATLEASDSAETMQTDARGGATYDSGDDAQDLFSAAFNQAVFSRARKNATAVPQIPPTTTSPTRSRRAVSKPASEESSARRGTTAKPQTSSTTLPKRNRQAAVTPAAEEKVGESSVPSTKRRRPEVGVKVNAVPAAASVPVAAAAPAPAPAVAPAPVAAPAAPAAPATTQITIAGRIYDFIFKTIPWCFYKAFVISTKLLTGLATAFLTTTQLTYGTLDIRVLVKMYNLQNKKAPYVKDDEANDFEKLLTGYYFRTKDAGEITQEIVGKGVEKVGNAISSVGDYLSGFIPSFYKSAAVSSAIEAVNATITESGTSSLLTGVNETAGAPVLEALIKTVNQTVTGNNTSAQADIFASATFKYGALFTTGEDVRQRALNFAFQVKEVASGGTYQGNFFVDLLLFGFMIVIGYIIFDYTLEAGLAVRKVTEYIQTQIASTYIKAVDLLPVPFQTFFSYAQQGAAYASSKAFGRFRSANPVAPPQTVTEALEQMWPKSRRAYALRILANMPEAEQVPPTATATEPEAEQVPPTTIATEAIDVDEDFAAQRGWVYND